MAFPTCGEVPWRRSVRGVILGLAAIRARSSAAVARCGGGNHWALPFCFLFSIYYREGDVLNAWPSGCDDDDLWSDAEDMHVQFDGRSALRLIDTSGLLSAAVSKNFPPQTSRDFAKRILGKTKRGCRNMVLFAIQPMMMVLWRRCTHILVHCANCRFKTG